MTDLTKEQFMEEIEVFVGTDVTFNVESQDGGSIYFSMSECKITVDKDFREIKIFKPYTMMEADICLDIVDNICKKEDEYRLEFNNGMADVVIVTNRE